MKFVDHQRLECVRQRVDIVHPSAPIQHVVDRDDEASEDDETKNDDSCGYHGLRKRSRGGSDGSEHHGHGQRAEEGREEVEEECARLASEIGHKVQCQVENDRVADLVRKITEHRGDGFGRWVVESVTGVFLDDRSLGVQRQDLKQYGQFSSYPPM